MTEEKKKKMTIKVPDKLYDDFETYFVQYREILGSKISKIDLIKKLLNEIIQIKLKEQKEYYDKVQEAYLG